MFFVESIVALVLATILPHIISIPMHHTILEHPFKVPSIRPLEITEATHFVVHPLPRVLAAISPEVNTLTLLDPFLEVSVVVAAIAPNFDAFSILLFWRRRFTPRSLLIDDRLPKHAEICRLILLPISLVDLVSGCSEDPNANNLAVDPVSLKGGHVWPDELPISTLVDFIIYC